MLDLLKGPAPPTWSMYWLSQPTLDSDATVLCNLPFSSPIIHARTASCLRFAGCPCFFMRNVGVAAGRRKKGRQRGQKCAPCPSARGPFSSILSILLPGKHVLFSFPSLPFFTPRHSPISQLPPAPSEGLTHRMCVLWWTPFVGTTPGFPPCPDSSVRSRKRHGAHLALRYGRGCVGCAPVMCPGLHALPVYPHHPHLHHQTRMPYTHVCNRFK